MSELNGVQTPVINSEVVVEDKVQVLDWKSSLSTVLGKTPDQIQFDREWSLLCREMRQLCPETEWMSINAPSGKAHHAEPEMVTALTNWLKLIVACPEWPFPQSVILINSSSENVEFLVTFSKQSNKLPYVTPPYGLLIVPWRDKHSNGWKITQNQTFSIDKAGEA